MTVSLSLILRQGKFNEYGFRIHKRSIPFRRGQCFSRSSYIADGWTPVATYPSELLESHATLIRDDYKIHVMARTMESGCKWKFSVQVSIWGPDRMAIDPPNIYNSDYIITGIYRCGKCQQTVPEIFRAGFANRCCATCLPIVRAKIEKPGWCD